MNSTFAPTIADSTTYQYGRELSRVLVVPVHQFPPVTTCLFGNVSEKFLIVQPLPINIEQDTDQSYVISDDIFLVYGEGNTRLKAIEDYTNSLMEFYTLVEKGAADNQFDGKTLSHLKAYIQPK